MQSCCGLTIGGVGYFWGSEITKEEPLPVDPNLGHPLLVPAVPAHTLETGFVVCANLTILHILRVACQTKVGHVHAGWNVTGMIQFHPFRDRANEQLVSEAMGLDYFSANANLPVAVPIPRSRPQPATVGLVDVAPEPLFD